MNKTSRLIVFPKDLISLTGKSYRSCQRLLSKIGESLGKDRLATITKLEVGEYLKIKKEDLDHWKLE